MTEPPHAREVSPPETAAGSRASPWDHAPTPTSFLSPGEMVAGKYRLVRYLARGGMAEVWLAEHTELRNEVAIKFVDPQLTSDRDTAPAALERFRFEAQISARISALTRHVVAVHDAGLHRDVPYLVMELVKGPTLEDEVEAKGPIAPERLARILDQAADGLAAAHSLGIVHRDLKPSNVMLAEDASGGVVVKVADFGVAKAIRRDLPIDRPRETAVGELVGSPAFMSPEQIRATRAVDARTDVWSLGVVAYESLTGHPCFEGSTLSDLMVAILGRVYEPASRRRPGLPKTLDAWFARAFAEAPEDRFTSVREMAEAYREALRAEPRRRLGVIAAGVALIASAGILALAIGLGSKGPAAAPTATATAATASAPPPAPSANPSATVAAPTASPTETARAANPLPPVRGAVPHPRAPLPAETAIAPPSATATAQAAPPPASSPPQAPDPPPPPPPTKKKKIDPSEIQ
jgi:hypothetical protein